MTRTCEPLPSPFSLPLPFASFFASAFFGASFPSLAFCFASCAFRFFSASRAGKQER